MWLDGLDPLLLLLGVVVGALVPRGGRAALLLLAGAGTLALGLAAATLADRTVIATALALCAAVALAVLAAGWLPRLTIFLLLAPLLMAVLAIEPQRHPWLAAAGGLVALLAALVLARPGQTGWHALAACAGAILIARGLPALDGLVLRLLAAGLLFFLSLRLGPPLRLEAIRFGRALGCAAAAGAFSAALVATLPRLLPALPSPAGEPWNGRRAQLLALAPGGGLVWPALEDLVLGASGAAGDAGWGGFEARWLTGKASLLPTVVEGDGSDLHFSLRRQLTSLRARKSPEELAELRLAGHATVEGVRELLPRLRPGATPDQLAAALGASWRARGCPDLAFSPLILSGRAASSPHGKGRPGPLTAGELVVIDVGCRTAQGYVADFTRTFPVDGVFTPEQRRLYEAVLAVRDAAVADCRPGVRLTGRRGGPSLSALASDDLAQRTGQQLAHALGHGVGLSVHDPLPDGPLEPGMVITIEPGLYLADELGIRIEDTLLVTETGCELLTPGLPAGPDELEAALVNTTAAR